MGTMAGLLVPELYEPIAKEVVVDLNEQDLYMAGWALSRHECQTDAWCLFGHAKRLGFPLTPLDFRALLTECEQRRLLEHELALLKGVGAALGSHCTPIIFAAA